MTSGIWMYVCIVLVYTPTSLAHTLRYIQEHMPFKHNVGGAIYSLGKHKLQLEMGAKNGTVHFSLCLA